MKKQNLHKKGFTIIESMVALSIFFTVATIPMEIIIKSLQTNLLSKNNLEDHFKAQEIIEVSRAIRDSNFINSRNWLSNLSQCSGKICSINYTAGCEVVNASGNITGLCFIDDTKVSDIFVKTYSVSDFCQIEKRELESISPTTKRFSTFYLEFENDEDSISASSVKFHACIERLDNKGNVKHTHYTERVYKWVVSD